MFEKMIALTHGSHVYCSDIIDLFLNVKPALLLPQDLNNLEELQKVLFMWPNSLHEVPLIDPPHYFYMKQPSRDAHH